MNCGQCVFFRCLQNNPISPPCISCSTDPSDKGFCVAVESRHGYVPVITKIADERRAREIIRRGLRNGSHFQLLSWSVKNRAYEQI